MLDSLTKKQGLKYDSPSSAKDIEPFIRFHHLNLVCPPVTAIEDLPQLAGLLIRSCGCARYRRRF